MSLKKTEDKIITVMQVFNKEQPSLIPIQPYDWYKAKLVCVSCLSHY